MRFTLVILSAPYSTPGSHSALNFARAALATGHEIHRLFFYGDGVHNASALTSPPQDEINLSSQWRELIEKHQLDSVVCIAAALRRGVLNQTEAERYGKSAANLGEPFELSGLGQLLEAAVQSDRVITFGGA